MEFILLVEVYSETSKPPFYITYYRMRIVVSEYAAVRIAFVCHYGGTYLA